MILRYVVDSEEYIGNGQSPIDKEHKSADRAAQESIN